MTIVPQLLHLISKDYPFCRLFERAKNWVFSNQSNNNSTYRVTANVPRTYAHGYMVHQTLEWDVNHKKNQSINSCVKFGVEYTKQEFAF